MNTPRLGLTAADGRIISAPDVLTGHRGRSSCSAVNTVLRPEEQNLQPWSVVSLGPFCVDLENVLMLLVGAFLYLN